MDDDLNNDTDVVRWVVPDAGLLTGTFAYLTGFEIVFGSERNGTRRIVRPVSGESGLPISSCQIYEFSVYTVIGGIICLLGLLGNGLCIGVFWPDRQRSSTIFLLMCLAFIDSSVLVTWTCVPLVVAYCRFRNTLGSIYRLLPYAQVYIYPLCTLTHMATTWSTVLLTIHRYVAVCRPFDAKRLATVLIARRQLAVVLVASLVFNLPRFLENRISIVRFPLNYTIQEDRGNMTAPRYLTIPIAVKRAMASSDLYENIYLVGAYYVVIYAAPLTLLAVFTCRLIRAINEAKVKRREMVTPKPGNIAPVHVDLTYSLVVVVAIFVICQSFNPARRILEAAATSFSSSISDEEDEGHEEGDSGSARQFRSHSLAGRHEECGSFYFFFAPIAILVVCINSAVNCLVYAACGRKFRANAWRILSCSRSLRDNAVYPTPAVIPGRAAVQAIAVAAMGMNVPIAPHSVGPLPTPPKVPSLTSFSVVAQPRATSV